MNYRKLGNTGIEVSEVGFGAWQLGDKGWGGIDGNEAINLIHEAIDKGCTLFDTAPPYGQGESEKLLGKGLEGKREKLVIVSKFGHNPTGPSDFSADKIRSSVERSLKSLKTDYLDSLLLHNPDKTILSGEQGHYDVLEDLKKEGLIRSYGASIDSSEDLNILMDSSKSQVCEAYFNAFQQEMALAFDRAEKNSLGLISKVPLDSGWLTGKYTSESVFTTGYRDRWSQEVKERRYELIKRLAFLKSDDRTMVQGAIRFILDFSQISTVIPGVKNSGQLNDNLGASNGRLTSEEVATIKGIWQDELATNPLGW